MRSCEKNPDAPDLVAASFLYSSSCYTKVSVVLGTPERRFCLRLLCPNADGGAGIPWSWVSKGDGLLCCGGERNDGPLGDLGACRGSQLEAFVKVISEVYSADRWEKT